MSAVIQGFAQYEGVNTPGIAVKLLQRASGRLLRAMNSVSVGHGDPNWANVTLALPMRGFDESNIIENYGPLVLGTVFPWVGAGRLNAANGLFGETCLQTLTQLPGITETPSPTVFYIPYNAGLDPGSGDFTIEFWAKKQVNHSSNTQVLFGTYSFSADGFSGDAGWFVASNGTNNLFFGFGNNSTFVSVVNISSFFTVGSWHFIAISRNSGTVRVYRDGSLITTVANSTNITFTKPKFYIGCSRNGATSTQTGFFGVNGLQGYIQDLRITKGVGRYPSTCPTPTAPLELYPTGLADGAYYFAGLSGLSSIAIAFDDVNVAPSYNAAVADNVS